MVQKSSTVNALCTFSAHKLWFSPHLVLYQVLNWVQKFEILVQMGKRFLFFLSIHVFHEYHNFSVDMGGFGKLVASVLFFQSLAESCWQF